MVLNIKKFMEKYPNITVTRDRQFTGEMDDFEKMEVLTARASEGTLPDVFYSPLAAEAYDRELTLDLTPYIESDEEADSISDNARSFMMSYDGEEIYGVPWMSVSQFPAINLKLLKENNISIPSYDWTYEEYENLRSEVAQLTPSKPIFPGIIDFSELGPHYFDSIPNGWKGYNSETERWDFSGSPKFGEWFELVAKEGKQGLHFYDLTEEERVSKVGNLGWPWGDGLEAIGNVWMYALSSDVNELVKNREMDIDIYPMPQAPEGGSTSLHGYYDTLSISSSLSDDLVKAEAAFQLVKWLSFGEEGLLSKWSLIDEYSGLEEDAPLRAEDSLMDFIQGWPVTTDKDVLAQHPFVKGFAADSPLAIFNFEAFKSEEFQQQLSNPIPFPRNMPAVANAFNNLDTWTLKNKIKDEGVRFGDIAAEWDETMNAYLDDYLRQYNK
ncbi:ABC transporter substrate-binding protein [Niallia sp. RD1]|nr:ABC transporter substrate-binding protein [Niallia sp. RD1]UTI42413.1 ABC transporter substrate-binding protein [Niallia sp. RD1]